MELVHSSSSCPVAPQNGCVGALEGRTEWTPALWGFRCPCKQVR